MVLIEKLHLNEDINFPQAENDTKDTSYIFGGLQHELPFFLNASEGLLSLPGIV